MGKSGFSMVTIGDSDELRGAVFVIISGSVDIESSAADAAATAATKSVASPSVRRIAVLCFFIELHVSQGTVFSFSS